MQNTQRPHEHERFALLRGILNQTPREPAWTQLIELFAHWPEDSEQRHIALDYAIEHTASWDAKICTATGVFECEKDERYTPFTHPCPTLVKHLKLEYKAHTCSAHGVAKQLPHEWFVFTRLTKISCIVHDYESYLLTKAEIERIAEELGQICKALTLHIPTVQAYSYDSFAWVGETKRYEYHMVGASYEPDRNGVWKGEHYERGNS